MPDRAETHDRAVQVLALIRCAMVAEENETSGLDWKGVAETLAVAEEIQAVVVEGTEITPGEERS